MDRHRPDDVSTHEARSADRSVSTRRQFLRGLAFVGLTVGPLASLLTACGGSSEAPTPTGTTDDGNGDATTVPATQGTGGSSEESVFIYGAIREPGTIDPGVAMDGQAYRVMRNVYDSLVHHVPGTFELTPGLAERWDISDDGLEYVFHIREGVTFHDGSKLDAEAIVVAVERVLTLNQGPATHLRSLKEMKVVDETTLSMTVKERDNFFLQNVVQILIPSAEAIRKHEKDGDLAQEWLSSNAAGTGAYRLEQWDKGQQFVLVRNPDYWLPWGERYFDRVIIRHIPEPATMRQMLEVGEVHFIDEVSPDAIDALSSNPDLKLVFWDAVMVDHITMNTQKGPTQDPKVREALYYAYPYEKARDIAYRGHAELATGPLGRGIPGYVEGPGMQQDLDRAREALAAAGYADGGLKVELSVTGSGDPVSDMAVIFQEEMRALGVEVVLRQIPWTQLIQLMSDPENAIDMGYLGMMPVTGDPVYALETNFRGSLAGQPWNWSYYNNPKVDELLDKARGAATEEEMERTLKEAVELIMADYPTIYAASPTPAYAMRKNVEGYVFIPGDNWYGIVLHGMYFS